MSKPHDRISGRIEKVDFIVNNGKVKLHRKKMKTKASEYASPEVAEIINDVVSTKKRDNINKEVRNDINPAKGAHSPVADTKKKISDEIRKLGEFN